MVRKSTRIDNFDENVVSLSRDLIDTMYDADGVGLAAPQIGVNKRIFVLDCSREDEKKDVFWSLNHDGGTIPPSVMD